MVGVDRRFRGMYSTRLHGAIPHTRFTWSAMRCYAHVHAAAGNGCVIRMRVTAALCFWYEHSDRSIQQQVHRQHICASL
jgi:hypothetical protein